jgi:hypothetical protein
MIYQTNIDGEDVFITKGKTSNNITPLLLLINLKQPWSGTRNHPLVPIGVEINGYVRIDKYVDKNYIKSFIPEPLPQPNISNKIEIESKPIIWVADWLEDDKWSIIDNEGNGDCLFACIRDAYTFKDINVTVEQLRGVVADSVTEDTLNHYLMIYQSLTNDVNEKRKKAEEKKLKYEELSIQYSMLKNKTTQKAEKIKEKAKNTKEEYRILIQEIRQDSNEELQEEFKFMENITTIDELKDIMKTPKYYADVFAINILETTYNFKCIILSFEAFNQNNFDNIINIIERNTQSKFYIILSYDGIHYTLVTYKNLGIFTKRNLPKAIKSLIN